MSTSRQATLDIARGLAIVAIVVGHVGRKLSDAGVLSWGPAEALDRSLYFTHLAVFVFVSGVLAPSSVARHGPASWLVARVRLFLYLYVLWSLIQGVVRVTLGELTNNAMSWSDMLALWVPRGHLWFLPFMAAASVVLMLARPWAVGRHWTVGVGALASLTVWGVSTPYLLTQGWALIGFLLVGAAVGQDALARLSRGTAPLLLVTGAAGSALYVWLVRTPAQPPTYDLANRSITPVLLGAIASVLGVVVVLALSSLLSRTVLSDTVASLGRHSLAIYLAHVLAAAGTRIALVHLGIDDSPTHFAAGVSAGVLLPLLLARVSTRRGARWLLNDPWQPVRSRDTARRVGDPR